MTDERDLPGLVDHERTRNAVLTRRRHERIVGVVVVAERERKLKLVRLGFDELFDAYERVSTVVRAGDRDHDEALLFVHSGEFVDVRHRRNTRPAPSGPEVQNVDFARLVAFEFVALEPHICLECRCRIADAEFLGRSRFLGVFFLCGTRTSRYPERQQRRR